MLRQQVKNLNKTLSFTGNSDEDLLNPLLAGKIEVYKEISSGGTELNQTPELLNRKSFIVSKNTPTGRLSAMIRIPHVKETFYFNELNTAVKGKFDASYESDTKCDTVKLNFDKIA